MRAYLCRLVVVRFSSTNRWDRTLDRLGRRLDQFRHTLADALDDAAAGFIPSAIDSYLERKAVGRTMALDHDPAQPEQARTVVAARIDPPAEMIDDRQRDQPAQLG